MEDQDCDYDTDHSTESSVRSKEMNDECTVDIISVVSIVHYTIPMFKVVTVELKQALASVWDEAQDNIRYFDIFLNAKQSESCLPCINSIQVPCTIDILDSCHVPVSDFVHTKYDRFPPSGVLVVWKWNVVAHESESDGYSTEEVVETSGDESPTTEDDLALSSHVLTFKCMGVTKSPTYQTALRRAQDLLFSRQVVPVRLVHEPNNPRDARALAFVCQFDDSPQRIGYVVSNVLDEVHAALNSSSIISIEFSWIRYITDWAQSGAPAFFAGIKIKKKGRWSDNAIRFSSTR